MKYLNALSDWYLLFFFSRSKGIKNNKLNSRATHVISHLLLDTTIIIDMSNTVLNMMLAG